MLRILALLLLFVPAVHAASARRGEVDAVAATIEANYFDAERGSRIARDLRDAAAAGEFDALATPEALAEALTARLQPLDHHFRVRWSADGVPPADARARGAQPMRPRMRISANGDAPGAGPDALRARGPAPAGGGNAPGDNGIRSVEIVPGNIGVLSLGGFAHFEFGRRGEPAREAIDAALQRLSATDAVIVDLRGNRGGSPAMVGYLVSAFTARGAPIYNVFHSRSGTIDEAPAESYPAPRLQVPLYVLVDARTGSAAESFAYTLKHAGRATIVGEHSGGAANPGRYFPAGDDLYVFVPTGSPVNPITGGNWEGTGVVPDVAVASSAALDSALALARKAAKP